MEINAGFLPHLNDPFRKNIAVRYARHEMRKLLPRLKDASFWQSADEDIGAWCERLSLRNFWNGIHGISMGFRLKSIVPWLTSLHMQWSERDVPLAELWFGGTFGPVAPLHVQESAVAVSNALSLAQHRILLDETRTRLATEAAQTAPGNECPLFAIRKEKGILRVIDGNRRLLQAIVEGRDAIQAFVGESSGKPALYEHWVPTSLLVDLVFWHKRHILGGQEATGATAEVIAGLIRDSSAGRIEFATRALHRDDDIHLRILRAVAHILAADGIVIA